MHTTLGEKILAPFLTESPSVLRIARSHHERMDGSGFPDSLRGDQIPLEARIVSVVDAFDAMTTNRAYRPSRPPTEAIQELRRCAGVHFDPEVVEAFIHAHADASTLHIP
jgi:HD-GYP domain-containing protein (c-di-GMP phosphodiesterase class II)